VTFQTSRRRRITVYSHSILHNPEGAAIFRVLIPRMNRNYQLGLLCLSHLLISADGVVDENELNALRIIKEKECIPDSLFQEFEQMVQQKKERDMFLTGIDSINQCSVDEKIKVLVLLYKLSEVDGRVHVREIRFLLYSIKLANVEFDYVVKKAMSSPSPF
jgi:uncharacterized tellurite resistance protein B-like protein